MSDQLLLKCLCCGLADLVPVIDLGEQVPANAVHDGTEPQRRYPLIMNRCQDCGHFQLDRSVDPETLYRDYPYATGVSASMIRHLESLADWIGPDKIVLEIGCNDGTLLRAMRSRGCTATGIDPATTFAAQHVGLDVVTGMWTEQVAAFLGKRFDIVVGTNVFAHLRDPNGALRVCDFVLKPGGIAVFEVHRAAAVILGRQFDTIYHEHLSYFTARSAAALAEGTPFNLVNVMPLDVHGGSFRLVYARDGSPCSFVEPPLSIEAYADDIAARRDALLSIVRPGAVCVGASARATVMLQAWRPSVIAAVDEAPLKIGKYIAGTNVPIFSFDWLKQSRPKQLILGAWNLYDTLRPRLAVMLHGSELVSYQPEIRMEVL
jgi:SAM-dependent methyltransferase